jgi:integrative and conjugative element protein (TIGR02256 family)
LPWLRRRRRRLAGTVWVPEQLLALWEEEAAEHAPDETGGMLVGYWSESGGAVITETIDGGPDAIRRPSRFEPNGAWQQQRLDEIYLQSGRLQTYLGDWHSHPHGAPRPSFRDRETAKKVATAKEARAPRPLTVICSKHNGRWEWAAFCYRRRRGFRRLSIARYPD